MATNVFYNRLKSKSLCRETLMNSLSQSLFLLSANENHSEIISLVQKIHPLLCEKLHFKWHSKSLYPSTSSDWVE